MKRIHHPVVGQLTLAYEAMAIAANPGLTIAVYTAEPASKSEEALNLLVSWKRLTSLNQRAQPTFPLHVEPILVG